MQVGVPGAFTGTCSAQVPGYIKAYEQFKERGVDNIYIVAVNDVFVTKAWKEKLAPECTREFFVFKFLHPRAYATRFTDFRT